MFEKSNRDVLKEIESGLVTLSQDPAVRLFPVVNLKLRPMLIDLLRVVRHLDARISNLEERR